MIGDHRHTCGIEVVVGALVASLDRREGSELEVVLEIDFRAGTGGRLRRPPFDMAKDLSSLGYGIREMTPCYEILFVCFECTWGSALSVSHFMFCAHTCVYLGKAHDPYLFCEFYFQGTMVVIFMLVSVTYISGCLINVMSWSGLPGDLQWLWSLSLFKPTFGTFAG